MKTLFREVADNNTGSVHFNYFVIGKELGIMDFIS